jgi:hypothetical protein
MLPGGGRRRKKPQNPFQLACLCADVPSTRLWGGMTGVAKEKSKCKTQESKWRNRPAADAKIKVQKSKLWNARVAGMPSLLVLFAICILI